MNLAPHIRKWWDPANDRRQRLILKKYKGGGLSDDQELELVLLQGIAEMIMSYASPVDFRPLEALERKVHRLAHRLSKASLKWSDKKKGKS